MLPKGPDGGFVRENREEGLNINISIFTFLKYLISFIAIFPWYKLIEKTEVLKIFDTSCPAIIEFHPCLCPLANSTGITIGKLN